MIFYASLVTLPLLQFLFFYVYVNFNSIILAFQKYTRVGVTESTYTFAGFENFRAAWNVIVSEAGVKRITNSITFFLIQIAVGYGLALFFSFYVYKKYPLAEMFRVILFLPSVISGIILALLFKYFVGDFYIAFMELFGTETAGLLSETASTGQKLSTVIFYNIWVSFGVNVLMFSNGMSAIDESIVESAQLDGTNLLQEFWYITIPSIWGTLSSFFIVSLTGIFTNQMHLHTMFGDGAPVQTFGYYLFVSSQHGLLFDQDKYIGLPTISALGLMITCVTAPITLGTRYLLEKYGPRTD